MEHSKAKARPGSAAMTLPWVVQRFSPYSLWPSNVAPPTGPLEPSCQAQARHSSDHSPIRVTSEMAAYTCSGDAAMWRDTSVLLSMTRSSLHASECCRAEAHRHLPGYGETPMTVTGTDRLRGKVAIVTGGGD